MTKVQPKDQPPTAAMPITWSQSSRQSPWMRPTRKSGAPTTEEAKMPVASAPQMPPTPCTPITSSESSSPVRGRQRTA